MTEQTWGVIFRTVEPPHSEQWLSVQVADVTVDDVPGYEARASVMPSGSSRICASPEAAVEAVGLLIASFKDDRGRRDLSFVKIETPAEYQAHFDAVSLRFLRGEYARFVAVLKELVAHEGGDGHSDACTGGPSQCARCRAFASAKLALVGV